MNSALTTDRPHDTASDLRKRAEARLNKELATKKTVSQHDTGQQLYEQRIEQIEIELLSEEFTKLRQKISVSNIHRQGKTAAGNGYFFLDSNGRIIDAKFSALQHNGMDEFKWIGRFLGDCIQPQKRTQFRKFLNEVFESNVKTTCEISFDPAASKKHFGIKLPLHAFIEAISDDARQICLAVVDDTSAKKSAEEQEKASKAAFAMLDKTISASRNEIFMFDANSLRFSFANQRALENLGYTLDELRLLTPADIQTPVSNEEMGELIDHLLVHRKSVRKLNALHKRKNGGLYPVEIYLQLFEQETGSYFIAIVLDISSQTAIESQMKSIVESAGAIIWAADIDLKLLFMSDQVLEILGYSAIQFNGYSLINLLDAGFFHESDRENLIAGFDRVIKNGDKVFDLRYQARHADGTWRWLSMNMTPNRSVDGRVVQIVGVMNDIHAQQLAEDALLQLNHELDFRVQEEIKKNMEKDALLQRQARLAAMGEMIGNIAHQWRQPINSLSLILSDLEDAAVYGECDLSYIQTAVGKSKKIIQKMSSTIDDFRHFFRADKSVGLFSLKQVTDECINLVEAAMKSSNINIVVKCEHDVAVSGYANEYSQAVMNILSNARDAIVERNIATGEIVIEIGEEDGFGVHSVTDNAGGIPPDVMPRIFEPHFTTKQHGTGIGLYMTLVTIEKNMNGRISAENVADGVRFTMYLPKNRTGDEHVIH